uniref:BTB domain-containing protein n=1 Tax=Oryza glumipatula TaxID=40148 RepID=A0A0E0BAR9_9ORYZ
MAIDAFVHLTRRMVLQLTTGRFMVRSISVSSPAAMEVSRVSECFVLTIAGYSRTKEAGYVLSTAFIAGGYSLRFTIKYFPICVSFMLLQVQDATDVTIPSVHARCKFTLLDHAGRPVPSHARDSPVLDWSVDRRIWCYSDLVMEEELKRRRPDLLGDDDCLAVRCDFVFVFPDVLGGAARPLPPSDLHQHLGKLLTEKEGADVTFQVANGETFAAHRCVLAARSPVFRAQLFSPMNEGSTASGVIAIDDMEAEVFSSLLNFIYTSSLLNFIYTDSHDDDGDDDGVMAQHLLAAAVRYGLDRMKLVCEEKLQKHIDGSSVGSILALADQHSIAMSSRRRASTSSAPAAALNCKPSRSISASSPAVMEVSMVSGCFVMIKMAGYSRTREEHRSLDSPPFSVGGYSWRIIYHTITLFYPGRMSFALVLLDRIDGPMTMNARCKFTLLDRAGNPVPVPSHARDSPILDWSVDSIWCCSDLVMEEELERRRSELLGNDDCLAFRCDIVFMDVLGGAAAAAVAARPLPPSDLHQHLGKLLSEKEGADVTFQMVAGGETFAAHRCVLAARSPVFRAQLFGPMKEGSTASGVIAIDDMEAEVFSSLLTFIYTDSLPPDAAADGVMVQHLLAAADRYGLDRMKLVCEEKLRKHIDGSSVGSVLSLAYRHNCDDLKEACFDFLSSGAKLREFAGTDAFEELIGSSPAVVKELFAKPSSRTASSIAPTAGRGSHCLKIDGFARTRGLPAGEHLRSGPFIHRGRPPLVLLRQAQRRRDRCGRRSSSSRRGSSTQAPVFCSLYYNIERPRLICEENLGEYIDVVTVVTCWC